PTRTRRSRRYSRPPLARRQPARPHPPDSQSKARTHAGSRLWRRNAAGPNREAESLRQHPWGTFLLLRRVYRRLDSHSLEGCRHLGENLEADWDAPLVHDEGWLMNVRADLTWSSYPKTPEGAGNLLQHPREVLPTKGLLSRGHGIGCDHLFGCSRESAYTAWMVDRGRHAVGDRHLDLDSE